MVDFSDFFLIIGEEKIEAAATVIFGVGGANKSGDTLPHEVEVMFDVLAELFAEVFIFELVGVGAGFDPTQRAFVHFVVPLVGEEVFWDGPLVEFEGENSIFDVGVGLEFGRYFCFGKLKDDDASVFATIFKWAGARGFLFCEQATKIGEVLALHFADGFLGDALGLFAAPKNEEGDGFHWREVGLSHGEGKDGGNHRNTIPEKLCESFQQKQWLGNQISEPLLSLFATLLFWFGIGNFCGDVLFDDGFCSESDADCEGKG